MNIRTKLFVFIPILVILVSSVTYFIFHSSKTIQESYNLMMERILVYKAISSQTQDNLRTLSNYLINQEESTYHDILKQRGELQALQRTLRSKMHTSINLTQITNYENMLDSFLEKEIEVLEASDVQGLQSYVALYEETEKIAGMIREQGQSLVDLELTNYQPYYKQILVNSQRMNSLGLSLFIVNILMCIVFVIWLSRSITRPINALVRMAKQISKGNLHITPPQFRHDDEFRILSDAFHQMLANIRELIAKDKENLERDRLVKELELKALQSQINPHFLFNTLNVLSKLALIEGADKTSNLTISVSNLLRYNLRKLDQPVTLHEEVEHTKEYFAIQHARFRERIHFELHIDEAALEQQIPCLSLQPIIENAFVHGVEGMEIGAKVSLTIRQAPDRTVIIIADNGAGMTDEIRRSLLDVDRVAPFSTEANSRSTGLGLHNVFKRLCLFYGADDIIGIESQLGQGATVTLRLPILKGGLTHVPDVNSR